MRSRIVYGGVRGVGRVGENVLVVLDDRMTEEVGVSEGARENCRC